MGGVIDLECNGRYAVGLLRALLGAMIFALPLFMTMEMWELGVVMDRLRLALLLAVTLPMLVAMSFYAGFEKTFSLVDNILDAFAAIAVAALSCMGVLAVFGQIGPGFTWGETVGKLAVLSFGGSIGALLADKQFNDGRDDGDDHRKQHGTLSRMFVMAIGAIFLALNVAPTDEVEIIASVMSPIHAAVLACVSVAALHLILTGVDAEEGDSVAGRFIRRTLMGYGVCLAMSWFILWSFGRSDGVSMAEVVERVVVLSFPAAFGAGAARLILGAKPND